MAPRKSKKDVKEFEVAIAGDGITPETVSLRETLDVLGATIALIEAVAQDKGLPAPRVSLVAVRTASADFVLTPLNRPSEKAIKATMEVTRVRGENASEAVIDAIDRLHGSAKSGPIRLRSRISGRRSEVLLAAPIFPQGEGLMVAEQLQTFEVENIVYGRVVRVEVVSNEFRVSLRLDDGGTSIYSAEERLAREAAPLLNQSVMARVTEIRGDVQKEGELVSIEAFTEHFLPDILRAISHELEARGESLGANEMLEEIYRERRGED